MREVAIRQGKSRAGLMIAAAMAAAGMNVSYGTSTVRSPRRSRFEGQRPFEKAKRLHAAEVKRQRRRARNIWNHGKMEDYVTAVERLVILEEVAP